MKNWIRWQGLIAFFIVAGLLAGIWFLVVDTVVKRLIEKTGGFIVGAQVDVNDLDVRLFPLGITLNGLQVTNPDLPATNSVECGRIAFNLDGLNLLRSKTIINEMAIERVRFDTPRKRPGWVKKREGKKEAGEKETPFALPVKIPDVKEILRNENLESLKLIETTKAELQKKKTDWQQRIEEMPNRATLDAYQERIGKIRKSSKGDILGMAGQLKEVQALRRDIEQNLENVKKTRTAFTNDLASARSIVERAEQAPLNDVRRLLDKYSISPAGLANMTQLVFGDQISSWVRSGLLWYNRLQPIVERAQAKKGDVTVVKHLRDRGVDVKFKEFRPLPDFLITRTAVSAETKAGLLAGVIQNITPDQHILRIPLTFSLSGEKLQAAKSVALTGTLNHINPLRQDDSGRFLMRGFRLQNLVLSRSNDLPITIQDGLVDFNLQGSFTQALKATFSANVNAARMNIGGEASSNPFVASIRSALSKVTNFSLSGDISGTLENYKVNISSDLDRVLKTAVSSVVQEQGARLEQQLKTAIQERTGAQLKDLKTSLGGLSEQGIGLENIQGQLNSLLQEAIKSAGGRLKFPR